VKAVGSRFLFEAFIQWRVSCGDFISGDVLRSQGLGHPSSSRPVRSVADGTSTEDFRSM